MTLPAPRAAKYLRLSLLAVAVLLSSPAVAFSQTAPSADDARIASLLDSLNRVRTPTAVAISPDGANLAWTVNGPRGSELHLTGIAPAGSAQDGAWERVLSPDTIGDVTNSRPGACPASNPAWSPDGRQLAFLSACSDSTGSFQPDTQQNLYIWTLAVNNIKQISHLHGEVGTPQWSPDGKSIAFLYVENATRQAGALDAMKPWSGVIGEDGVEVQRVATVGVSRSFFFMVTPQELHVYEFAWNPAEAENGGIVFTAAHPPGENTWWIARLYVQKVCHQDEDYGPEEGKKCFAHSILDPQTIAGSLHGLQIAVPRFSPDGKQIAFIGGLMSDQGSTGGDIYLIPSTGLKSGDHPKDVTPDIDGTPTWLNWQSDHTVAFVENRRGHTLLNAVNTNDLKIVAGAPVDLGEISISGGPIKDAISVAIPPADHKNPTGAFVESSYAHPPEIFAGPVDHLQQMTHLNDALKPSWGKSESINYTNDGFDIQGWLLYPANYDPAKKYPLVVSVHGGPSSAFTPGWPAANYGAAPLSALDYFVFMPNPRGSFGQGEKFTQANIKDFGYGDLRDILAGVDLLEKRFPIDRDREGITGWSYGGFMTMFAVTQTTRFKAAVAGAGISNWQSYYGENSIDQWMVPFFGASVYDDPAVYAKSSAINFIKAARTPTLLLVGDRDGECPAPQSFEFWRALRDLGVKTQLVVYPNEGHHIADPAHQRDVLKRALDWFQTEMPPK